METGLPWFFELVIGIGLTGVGCAFLMIGLRLLWQSMS